MLSVLTSSKPAGSKSGERGVDAAARCRSRLDILCIVWYTRGEVGKCCSQSVYKTNRTPGECVSLGVPFLGLLAATLTVQPLADVVSYYTGGYRKNEVSKYSQSVHPLSVASVGAGKQSNYSKKRKKTQDM